MVSLHQIIPCNNQEFKFYFYQKYRSFFYVLIRMSKANEVPISSQSYIDSHIFDGSQTFKKWEKFEINIYDNFRTRLII